MLYYILLLCLFFLRLATWIYITKKKTMISIEGTLAVGKTSIMDLLKDEIEHDADFIYEPIEEWHAIKGNDGLDLLQTFYNDKKRWSYTFQNIAYITRMNHIIDKITNSNKQYIILDRSLAADLNTFAKMLHDDGFIDSLEWSAYGKWNKFFNTHYGHLVEHKIIYLRSEPSVAYERMRSRNRDAEKNVPLSYLELVHKYHDNWLFNTSNVLVIDANRDFVKDKERFSEICGEICNFIDI